MILILLGFQLRIIGTALNSMIGIINRGPQDIWLYGCSQYFVVGVGGGSLQGLSTQVSV